MKYLLEICVIFMLANFSFLPKVLGQDTSDYLTVQMFQGLCWYTVSNEAGYVIATINFDDDSGIDMITTLSCKLTIQAPVRNQGVLLRFTSFNVTETEGCIDDSVRLFDGEDTAAPEMTPTGGLCGDFIPDTYMSSGEYLTILFYTDQLGDGYQDLDYVSEFKATWTAFRGVDEDFSSVSYESAEPIGSDDLFCCESNDACISLQYTCDGIRNCEDGSDEGPSACTVDYGVFGSLEILAVVLVSLALVTSFFAFIAFITCFCRYLLTSDENKRLLESTEFIYQDTSGVPPQSSEHLMERTHDLPQEASLMTFPGGIPRATTEFDPSSYSRPIEIIRTSAFDDDTQLLRSLRRQASLEDRSRNVVYNNNAYNDADSDTYTMSENEYRSMLLSNFSYRLPRAQIQEPQMVRSRSMESIDSYNPWDNFILGQRATDDSSTEATESIQLGIDPYEVISQPSTRPSTLYVNEPRNTRLTVPEVNDNRYVRRTDARSGARSSQRRSRSLSPSPIGRSESHDLLSPDEEWHVGRTPTDYEQLANMIRTRDVPRFFLRGPTPNVPGSEV